MDFIDVAKTEGVGEAFQLEGFMAVRARTRTAVHLIAEQITPGMSEEEAKRVARATLSYLSMRRGWHRIVVRCGSNTTKSFTERSEPGIILQEHDIFFVDIGPIYGDYEGDAGETFVLGDDPVHLKAKQDVREIWNIVRGKWLAERLTGSELYEFAAQTARQFGWRLNLDLSGHRLSEYPHSAHYGGSLAEIGFRPSPDLWVLEIAIVHPVRRFGAFFEDLLSAQES